MTLEENACRGCDGFWPEGGWPEDSFCNNPCGNEADSKSESLQMPSTRKRSPSPVPLNERKKELPDEDCEVEVRWNNRQRCGPLPRRGFFVSRGTRLACAFCAVLLIVLAIVLGITLSGAKDDEIGITSARSEADNPFSEGGPGEENIDLVKEYAPPGTKVTKELARTLSKMFAIKALKGCTDESLLKDPSTIQGQVVEIIVDDIMKYSHFNPDGTFFIPVNLGEGFIQDRYGLMRLYQETGGNGLKINSDWMKSHNQCSRAKSWFGIEDCIPYFHNDCGVLSLSLNSEGLKGELPPDLCCMKCLNSISVLDNAELTSAYPHCLAKAGVSVAIGDTPPVMAETSEVIIPFGPPVRS